LVSLAKHTFTRMRVNFWRARGDCCGNLRFFVHFFHHSNLTIGTMCPLVGFGISSVIAWFQPLWQVIWLIIGIECYLFTISLHWSEMASNLRKLLTISTGSVGFCLEFEKMICVNSGYVCFSLHLQTEDFFFMHSNIFNSGVVIQI